MKIVVTERVAREYGASIRKVVPRARLAVASLRDGGLEWSMDPVGAEVCCFSEDMWADLDLRRTVLPVVFRLEGLKWFHTFSAGVDAPVFQQLIDRGAKLTNSSGASAPAIAQYVLAMMLHHVKGIAAWEEQQRRREWLQHGGGELTDMTVGIIGLGAIGGEVARLAKAFRMRTLGLRRSPKRTPYVDEQHAPARLHALLKRSDFVVLACPLTKETDGLIGERELRSMKASAVLINIARGRVVQETTLVRALDEGWIAGACLDVFAVEPLPEDSPLWSLPNVMVTPHNSGASAHNMARSMDIFLDNLSRFAAGKKLRNEVKQAGV
ncbi:MAG TPA: D-2-hydroxyacid dehydrogenase [Dehalococcoidia bacterium]|nr:D-2-hydroxyacid dehydrogenase [Dehalococcoidia bacterium]